MARTVTVPDRATGTLGERGVAPAVLWAAEGDGDVRCVACAHRCLIRGGRRGICGVRENRGGRLVTLVHGEAVSVAVEPIEKKPLFHFHPGTLAFSVATRGCNFHCPFCQNWEISQADRVGVIPPATHLPPAALVALALRSGARSVAYTYVEPIVFVEYVLDTSRLAREAGLANVLVTNGYYTPEALDLVGPLTDAANVDLKSFSDAFYRKVCGARLTPVLESLVGLRARGVWIEVTTLVIPGLNDSPAELRSLARWISTDLGPETPWHVSRFYPAYRMGCLPGTPRETIRVAVELGREAGLRHVYPGNVDGWEADTVCAACHAILIRRRGFQVVQSRLVDGGCPACGRRLAGVGLAGDRPGVLHTEGGA